MSQTITNELKQEIITKINQEGLRVVDASATYNVSTKTIYQWLKRGTVGNSQNLILENNRLKKENEQLYAMLGKATALTQRPKK